MKPKKGILALLVGIAIIGTVVVLADEEFYRSFLSPPTISTDEICAVAESEACSDGTRCDCTLDESLAGSLGEAECECECDNDDDEIDCECEC